MGENSSEVRGNVHTTIVWSLSVMNTTWLNTAEERFAQTLSGARLSPYSSGRVLCMNNNHNRVTSSRGIFVGVGGSRRQKHSSTAGVSQGAVEGLRRLALPEALLDRRGR
jgi:hypothetical protein